MTTPTLTEFLARPGTALAKGPLAMIFAEDESELTSTLRHHLDLGFKSVLFLAPDSFAAAPDVLAEPLLHRIRFDAPGGDDPIAAVNAVAAAAPGIWMYYCFNAEYLFYPFCETRSIAELLAFHTEERRDAMLTYVIDIYAPDLGRHPDAVSLEEAHLDRSGYYALGRPDPRQPETTPRSGSLIFSAGCAGGSRNISPQTAARSTGSRSFARARACACAPITRSRTRNTTPMPAPGTTT